MWICLPQCFFLTRCNTKYDARFFCAATNQIQKIDRFRFVETCRILLVGVPGFEPGASWSRRLVRKFNVRFRAHLVLCVTGVVAFRTSLLPCLRPLPAWSGSAFGSWPDCCLVAWPIYPYQRRTEKQQGNGQVILFVHILQDIFLVHKFPLPPLYQHTDNATARMPFR